MAELGSGLRAYVGVRRSAGDPQFHIAKGRAFAVCGPHVLEFAKQLALPKGVEASIRLIANRPDIDAELQALEIAGKGRATCTVCSGAPRWQPKGNPLTMADVAESAPKAIA